MRCHWDFIESSDLTNEMDQLNRRIGTGRQGGRRLRLFGLRANPVVITDGRI